MASKKNINAGVSPVESDYGCHETQQKGGGIDIGYTADGDHVGKLKYQNHFDYLYNRGVVDDLQWAAGEYLRRDAYVSGQFAYIKSSADFSVGGNNTDEQAPFVADTKKRYISAMKSLCYQEAFIINIIVIDDGYITGSWRKVKSANIILRDGLNSLIKFYGL